MLERRSELVYRLKVPTDPIRELEGGDAIHPIDGLMRKVRVTGEVEARHGETALVSAIEVQGATLGAHAHAHNGEAFRALRRPKDRPVRQVSRREDDALAVPAHPVEVAPEVHRTVRAVESN